MGRGDGWGEGQGCGHGEGEGCGSGEGQFINGTFGCLGKPMNCKFFFPDGELEER